MTVNDIIVTLRWFRYELRKKANYIYIFQVHGSGCELPRNVFLQAIAIHVMLQLINQLVHRIDAISFTLCVYVPLAFPLQPK